MKSVFRTDRGTLRKPERTAQGFLSVEGIVARPGIYEYLNTREDEAEGYGKAGTIRRELRPDDEAHSSRALASYTAAPVTIGHPRKPDGEPDAVTPENVRALEVGTVMGARRDGNDVAAAIVIKDRRGIKAAEGGAQELSPGYRIDIEKRSGIDPKYGRYDAIQRNIVVNHLALVERARGGSSMRLRMDEAIRSDHNGKLTTAVAGHQHLVDLDPAYGSKMSGCTSWAVSEGATASHEHAWVRGADGKVTIGEAEGHGHEILDESAVMAALNAARRDGQIDRSGASRESGYMATINNDELVRSLRAQLDAAEAKLKEHEGAATTHAARADAAEARIITITGENSELRSQIAAAATVIETEAILREKVRADAAESNVQQLLAARDGEIKARCKLMHTAGVVMGPTFRMDDLTEREIRATVVKRLDAQADTSAAVSDAHLTGRFESLVELHARNARSQQRVADIIVAGTVERADSLEEKRRKRIEADNAPLPSARAKVGG